MGRTCTKCGGLGYYTAPGEPTIGDYTITCEVCASANEIAELASLRAQVAALTAREAVTVGLATALAVVHHRAFHALDDSEQRTDEVSIAREDAEALSAALDAVGELVPEFSMNHGAVQVAITATSVQATALLELWEAAQELVDDVRRRYPGEPFRCPIMQRLADTLDAKEGV